MYFFSYSLILFFFPRGAFIEKRVLASFGKYYANDVSLRAQHVVGHLQYKILLFRFYFCLNTHNKHGREKRMGKEG